MNASSWPRHGITRRWPSTAAVVAVLGLGNLLLLAACSSSSGPDGEDDGTAPAPVEDLRVTDFTASSVTLAWTATGDDGDQGTATRYEVRRSDVFIHPGTWDAAAVVPDPPTPHPAGTTESFVVTGLTEETTYFFAMTAFDEEGNSFGVSNCVEALCIDNEIVTFADAALEAAVRAQLGIADGDLRRYDLRQLHDLDAVDAGITSLVGLEECLHLHILHLGGNQIADLTPLTGLVEMGDLGLRDNAVTDVGALAGMTALIHLDLDENAVADLTPLAGLGALEMLRLEDNAVTDVAPLAGLTSLEQLLLGMNQIGDVSPLASLTGLTELSLRENQITDVAPLAGLVNLQRLSLTSNTVGDLSGLAGMTELTYLEVMNGGVTSVSPLSGLTSLTTLFLANNTIVDVSPLAGLTDLAVLHLGGNQITGVAGLAGLTALRDLYIYANTIVDLTPLSGLTGLANLQASYNDITDLAPLVANAGLGTGDTVNVENNPLSALAVDEQIPALQARGVEVLY